VPDPRGVAIRRSLAGRAMGWGPEGERSCYRGIGSGSSDDRGSTPYRRGLESGVH
jgi:hypothetical protein